MGASGADQKTQRQKSSSENPLDFNLILKTVSPLLKPCTPLNQGIFFVSDPSWKTV